MPPQREGNLTPKRSDKRPVRMPPSPKPTIVSVYGSEASARATPNSAWIRGSTTVTEYMPEPPSVISCGETINRVQAWEDSASAAAPAPAFMRRLRLLRPSGQSAAKQ